MMNINPIFLLLFSGLILHKFHKFVFRFVALLIPIISIFYLFNNQLEKQTFEIFNYQIFSFANSDFALLIGIAFLFTLFLGILYSISFEKYQIIVSNALFSCGCALGALYADDLITLCLMLELLSISSVVMICQLQSNESYLAAKRYIFIHLFSALLLIIATIINFKEFGNYEIPKFNIDIDYLGMAFLIGNKANLVGCLILISILIKAGSIPLSFWIPDSYSAASPLASVFLSIFTTKVALFLLLKIFQASSVLVPIGIIMIFYGILYGFLANDLRKILSYSLVNQIGFTIVAIGIGNVNSNNASAINIFCHILYQTLLFMCIATVIRETGRTKCSEFGSVHIKMRLITIFYTIGAMSVLGFPFTVGFVGKTIILESLNVDIWIWMVMIISSCGAILHAGLRLPWVLFSNHKATNRKNRFNEYYKQQSKNISGNAPPYAMFLALSLLSCSCVILGILPGIIFELLPQKIYYEIYQNSSALHQIQLLAFSALAFFFFIPSMEQRKKIVLDFDWFYRIIIKKMLFITSLAINSLQSGFKIFIDLCYKKTKATLNIYIGHKAGIAHASDISSIVSMISFLLLLMLLSLINIF